MIVHHAQAVQMAEIVRDKTESDDMRLLASDISLTQQAQVDIMQGWLAVWGLPITGSEPSSCSRLAALVLAFITALHVGPFRWVEAAARWLDERERTDDLLVCLPLHRGDVHAGSRGGAAQPHLMGRHTRIARGASHIHPSS